jgi:hypothetical protein
VFQAGDPNPRAVSSRNQRRLMELAAFLVPGCPSRRRAGPGSRATILKNLEFFPGIRVRMWDPFLDYNENGPEPTWHESRAPVQTSPRHIPCPACGADVEVHLGLAPGVIWQAVRLQSHRPGATAFCPHCNSYFVFGPARDDSANGRRTNAAEAPEPEPQQNEHDR